MSLATKNNNHFSCQNMEVISNDFQYFIASNENRFLYQNLYSSNVAEIEIKKL